MGSIIEAHVNHEWTEIAKTVGVLFLPPQCQCWAVAKTLIAIPPTPHFPTFTYIIITSTNTLLLHLLSNIAIIIIDIIIITIRLIIVIMI